MFRQLFALLISIFSLCGCQPSPQQPNKRYQSANAEPSIELPEIATSLSLKPFQTNNLSPLKKPECFKSVLQIPKDHTQTVGEGTPESCNFSALSEAVQKGGHIQFNCGPLLHVIPFSETLHITAATHITGDNKVRFSGQDYKQLLQIKAPTVLQGLTLENGYSETSAGAIYVAPKGELVLQQTLLQANRGSHGGAIYMEESSLNIVDAEFKYNSAQYGGALHLVNQSQLKICNALFHRNESYGQGGAIVLQMKKQASGHINMVHFDKNATTLGENFNALGGAIHLKTGHLRLENSSFVDNHAAQKGGAVALEESAEIVFQNTTFYRNTAGHLGGAIYGHHFKLWHATLVANHAGHLGGAISMPHLETPISSSIQNSIFLNNTNGEKLTANSVCDIAQNMPKASHVIQYPYPQNSVGLCAQDAEVVDPSLSTQLKPLLGYVMGFIPQENSPAYAKGNNCTPFDSLMQERKPHECTLGAVEANETTL